MSYTKNSANNNNNNSNKQNKKYINSLHTKVQMINIEYLYFIETKERITNCGMSGNNVQGKGEFRFYLWRKEFLAVLEIRHFSC